ncbi:MAG: aminoacyl-tRNA hydrolase [Epulopiscium sp.]|nr:aminoacyl-tRNA hydrolase [Candidatus Epulonipiscium sp.]
MYAVVGLGNPGLKYEGTRHNIGFEVVEYLASRQNIEINKGKHKGLIGEGKIHGKKVVLVQPQTYMNLSGRCVQEVAQWYKILPERVIVVYDDISLDLGDLRIRGKGSAGGHNGMKDIIAHLGTQDFPRVRVGIGEKPPRWDLADYVLQRFSKQELEIVSPTITLASEAIEEIIKDGLHQAMNVYNQKRKGPSVE